MFGLVDDFPGFVDLRQLSRDVTYLEVGGLEGQSVSPLTVSHDLDIEFI